RPAGQRAAKTCQIGRPQPFLALAMQDVDVAKLRCEPVGKVPGSVRGVVVDHEDMHALVSEGAQHRLEVLALVVGGKADGRAQSAMETRAARSPSPRRAARPRRRPAARTLSRAWRPTRGPSTPAAPAGRSGRRTRTSRCRVEAAP